MKAFYPKNLVVVFEGLGNILRTTSIFRILKGENYFLSNNLAKFFIPQKNKFIRKIIPLEEKDKLVKINFDLILNLEENLEFAKFLTENINFKKLIGVYYDKIKDQVNYTPESQKWFDMSLISKFGIKKANKLKIKNRKSYQEIIFDMLGKKFKGEEYLIKIPNKLKSKSKNKIKVAIENRVSDKWPMKVWPFYDELSKKIIETGCDVFFLKQRKRIFDYFRDIYNSDILITGDTFAMHIGIGFKKKVISLFNCTSPWEIYDYGRVVKIINPFLNKLFYRRDYDFKLVSGIKIEDVFQEFVKVLKSFK